MKLSRKEACGILGLPEGADTKVVTTSYLRLAEKFYPEGDDESAKLQRFKVISMAYSRLMYADRVADDEIHMTVAEMLRLYDDMVDLNLTDSDEDYDDDDYDDDEDDDDLGPWHRFHKMQMRDIDGTGDWTYNQGLTAEQIEKNANELITEEEREKRKAEKRRAKKKRRREKKRQEKLAENNKVAENSQPAVNGKASHENSNSNSSSKKSKKDKKKEKESEDEELFDPNAAFFTKVISKKKKGVIPETTGSSKNKSKQSSGRTEEDSQELDQIVLRSRQLAIRGNEMANMGEYAAAIDLFSEAIKLDPNDFRFFGNRSYCYDGIEQYDKALRDANKAIDLSPDWPKGYFRKGRALAGLKQYADAEQAFMQVLKLDRNCEDANQELFRVRTHQLMEMGFTRIQAEAGLRQYGSVQQALDSLLSGLVADTSVGNEVYISDDEDEVPAMPAKSNKTQVFTQHPVFTHVPISTSTKPQDTKMDPTNPEGLTALWVGNVLPEVTDKKLQLMFSKFGTVTSVRCLPEKFCAFVNFKTKEAAGKAMQGLQGVECAGQRLLIKFPDNPITSNGQTLIKKPTNPTTISAKVPQNFRPAMVRPSVSNAVSADSDEKLSGPVNGDECYFWRTTGCSFGKTCRYKHIPTHKGIDRKPWHTS